MPRLCHDVSTYLHAIGVKLPHRGYTPILLDLDEATLQCLQLVVNRQQSLRHWFGCQHKRVDVRIRPSDQIEQSSLCPEISWSPPIVHPVSVLSALINSVKLSLEIVQIRLSKRPCLCKRKFLEVVANLDELIVDWSPLLSYFSLSLKCQWTFMLSVGHLTSQEPCPTSGRSDGTSL